MDTTTNSAPVKGEPRDNTKGTRAKLNLIGATSLDKESKAILRAMLEWVHDTAGDRVYPSVDRLARSTSICERTVRARLGRLRDKGILVPYGRTATGTTKYRMDFAALESAVVHEDMRWPGPGFRAGGGASDAGTGVHDMQGGVHGMQGSPAWDAPNPRTDPKIDPRNSIQEEIQEEHTPREAKPNNHRGGMGRTVRDVINRATPKPTEAPNPLGKWEPVISHQRSRTLSDSQSRLVRMIRQLGYSENVAHAFLSIDDANRQQLGLLRLKAETNDKGDTRALQMLGTPPEVASACG